MVTLEMHVTFQPYLVSGTKTEGHKQRQGQGQRERDIAQRGEIRKEGREERGK